MPSKSSRIAEIVARFSGQELDAHYLGYFECFNRHLFYEAHEVLEHLWLGNRGGPDGAFYKGLIQLAGAFVHLQKGRNQPAVALFALAEKNLLTYPAIYHLLDLSKVLALISEWRSKVQFSEVGQTKFSKQAPELKLEGEGGKGARGRDHGTTDHETTGF